MELTLKLSPSKIGPYFENKCDLNLFYYSLDKKGREALNLEEPDHKFKETAATKAGNEWEKKLLNALKDKSDCNVIELSKDAKLDDTVAALKKLDKNKTNYIYQSCLEANEIFKKKYLSGLDGHKVTAEFGRMFPDFIRAEYDKSTHRFVLTVIDSKNASNLKIAAQIQIAIYAMVLKDILNYHGITDCKVNEEIGIVWNRKKITDKSKADEDPGKKITENCLEHEFDLTIALKELEGFFKNDLVKLCENAEKYKKMSGLQFNSNYRILQTCEYCDIFESCKEFCALKENVRLLPYIRPEAHNRLDELIASGDLKDDSIGSVFGMLRDEDNSHLLTDNCAFWNRIKNEADAYEKGLEYLLENKMVKLPKKDSSTISFPKEQDFSLLLTAQRDIDSGRIYAFACLLVPKDDLDGQNNFEEIVNGYRKDFNNNYYYAKVAESNDPDELDSIDVFLVESIYALMKKINDYNGSKTLQCYVMDDYERINIENTLFYMLEHRDPDRDKALLKKVISILFWFQGDRFVTGSDKLPEDVVETPMTVLTTEISKLYVLSKAVSYSLKDMHEYFQTNSYYDKAEEKYFGVQTNAIEGSIINDIWKKKKDLDINPRKNNTISDSPQILMYWFGNHLLHRLYTEYEIIRAIQTDTEIKLTSKAEAFAFKNANYLDDPLIAKLYFENQLEMMYKYHSILSIRTGGIQNAIDKGTILQLEYKEKYKEKDKDKNIEKEAYVFKILNRDTYIGKEWFTARFCEDNHDNRNKLLNLRERGRNGNTKSPNKHFYQTEMFHKYNFSDNGKEAFVEFHPKNNFAPEDEPKVGKKYLMFEVYSDFNGEKTAKGLAGLAQGDNIRLLEPEKLSGKTELEYDEIEKDLEKYWSPDGNTFSRSQKKAFIHLVENKLTVLTGPPASGKTDFISRSLIALSRYYSENKKKQLKILVSAMSHSAIETVLLKLNKMLGNNGNDISIYKVSKFDDKSAFSDRRVELIKDDKDNAGKVAEKFDNGGTVNIFGMTCWSAYKAFIKDDTMREFDIIVIDEASQLRAMDAFLVLQCSNENTRFLLVGDDNQLPPIIAGKYEEDDKMYPYGSVFRMFTTGLRQGSSKDHPDLISLYENFRMNGILCRYSAQEIYDKINPSGGDDAKYRPANDKVKYQKISLMGRSQNDLLRFILDERYPLIFCELSGAAAEQKETEINIVTQLVCELRKNLIDCKSGQPYANDSSFWQEGCGIISPHHEHINRLKTTIRGKLDTAGDIYIGTVEKLQGKERNVVIVSYGVSEEEKIKNEKEFLFSKNRFNVSITRGKAKTIVFLSEVISRPNLNTTIMKANDEVLEEGIDFIQGFAAFMEKAVESEVFENGKVKVWRKRLEDQP